MNVWIVFVVALGTALATGLGVLPVKTLKFDHRRSIALSSAIAAGFMLGASAGLVLEGVRMNPLKTLVGAVLGVAFILLTRTVLGEERDVKIGSLRGSRGFSALIVIGVMTMHSFTEGVALGVSSAGREELGILIAVAIAIHNIPEGVAISLALVPFGESAWRAAGWSIFTSLPQPLMAVPAYLAVRTFEPLLPAGLGFAAGAMVWMVATQLLPESMAPASRKMALVALVSSTAAMVAIELAIGL
jgi:zinc transporter ZupT